MVEPLRRVLVRRPDACFGNADPEQWHYTARPDLDAALREHDDLVAILRQADIEVIYHDHPDNDSADAIYTHDPSIVTERGAILLNMGKTLRDGEPTATAAVYHGLDIPILARIRDPGRAEGGDLLWLDRHTLAVGQGFRTNADGLRQLAAALEPIGVSVVGVELPFFQGEQACLHLMSLISLVDRDLALVYSPLLPVSFWRLLRDRGFGTVEVPEEEFGSMGPNVLALGPRRCLMLEGNPVTLARLERAGCTVETYVGREISLKAEGGATCLTRPLLRY